MKITLLFSFLTIMFFPPIENSQIAKLDGEPAIFKHSDFTGRYDYLNVSRSNLGDYGWNDHISAVDVPSDWKLVFYKHVGFCGDTFTVHPGRHNLYYYGWNDKASSVKVYYKGKLQGYAYSCKSSSKSKKRAKDPGDHIDH